MVGHSANNWNNHIDILNSLIKFRYENIRIFIPLSTGVDNDYKCKVANYAKKLFGNKVICIYKTMSEENYTKFLWQMDVIVFRIYRQAGIGNLMKLMYMGKTIYLPKNTTLYNFFNNNNIEIRDCENIESLTFEDFKKPVSNTVPPEYVLKRTEPKLIIEKWRYIFNMIEKRNGFVNLV